MTAVVAANTRALSARSGTLGRNGAAAMTRPPAINADTSTGRKPIRSPSAPPSGETTAPASAAVPTTSAISLASPPPDGLSRSTRIGTYGRVIWEARKATPNTANTRRVPRSDKAPRMAP